MIGIPGLVIQGYSAMKDAYGLFALGTILLVVAFGFYAKSKNRSPAWGLVGLLGIIGLLVLALIKEKPQNPNSPKPTT